MQYISTRNSEKTFTFKDVFLKGLATDGGLFIPKNIPKYTLEELNNLRNLSYEDLAVKLIYKFCDDEFSENKIKDLVNASYKDFRVQNVVKITKIGNKNLLELFHGPTLAFKDIAMQIIGNMYEEILKKNNSKINIIVATSGDTGAAAISAIKNRKNIKIFVLHPNNKISEVQRKFMTTTDSDNVYNLALEGNFDDCQKLVKSMFNDKDFNKKINMSGVNSINWARIVAQIVYFFFSYFQTTKENEKINFSVPTGNFGDIYAGYVAKKMGLPINKLIIATNENDILKRVINKGIYRPSKTQHTISPSMDIQVASNFERLIFDICLNDSNRTLKLMNELKDKGEFTLEKEELKRIKNIFSAGSLTEEETKLTIKSIYNTDKILIDPHTAVGVGVANKITVSGNLVVLATAHPAKFYEVVEKVTKLKPELPESLKNILNKKEVYEKISHNMKVIQNYILERI
jgi:threonine synthase